MRAAVEEVISPTLCLGPSSRHAITPKHPRSSTKRLKLSSYSRLPSSQEVYVDADAETETEIVAQEPQACGGEAV